MTGRAPVGQVLATLASPDFGQAQADARRAQSDFALAEKNLNRLRDLHAAACRRFNIVLGPDANAYHHDHLHFDMGSGRYCR